MITSRNNFHFYLQANMMINRGYFKEEVIAPYGARFIMEFLKAMKKVQYYSHNCQNGGIVTYNQ